MLCVNFCRLLLFNVLEYIRGYQCKVIKGVSAPLIYLAFYDEYSNFIILIWVVKGKVYEI